MDLLEIRKAVARVIRKHREAFEVIGASQTKLLELGAVTGIAEHYRSRGYKPRVINPKGKNSFIVKTSARGFPWNFSRILIERDSSPCCELHMNLSVEGAHGVGVYCVDVGIVTPGSVPAAKPAAAWRSARNSELITFAEVKKLVIYPMLLAQFVGIVHEIKPAFLSGRGSMCPVHPSPMLIVLGHYSANSFDIVQHYHTRGISVIVAANYDGRLARVRAGITRGPFDDGDVHV